MYNISSVKQCDRATLMCFFCRHSSVLRVFGFSSVLWSKVKKKWLRKDCSFSHPLNVVLCYAFILWTWAVLVLTSNDFVFYCALALKASVTFFFFHQPGSHVSILMFLTKSRHILKISAWRECLCTAEQFWQLCFGQNIIAALTNVYWLFIL